MSLTFSTAEAVLKEDYKSLKEQINQSFFILAQIDKNTDDVVGRRAYHALHVSRNSGVGARGDGGTLPTAGRQGYTNALVPMRFNYGRIEISGPVIAAMSKDRGSFVRAVRSEMTGISKDLKRDVNRQVWGTSDGVIAACGTTSSSVTIQLATTTTAAQMRQLWADGGSRVDIGTVADPVAIASGRLVTAYDISAKTITIDGATVSTTGSHRVYRSGAGGVTDNSGDVGDGQLELTGLQDIISNTGTLHGVNPATYPSWKALVKDNGGSGNRSVSETLINTAIQDASIESDEQVKLLISNAGVSRAIAALMQSMKRNIDNVELKGGYKGIRWSAPMEGMDDSGDIALRWDRDCPANALYGISPESLVQYEMSDWDWMQEDGAILSRVSNKHAYEATYFKLHELACYRRNANFVITELTEASA